MGTTKSKIREAAYGIDPAKVDADNAVIRGVKIIGCDSKNQRRYTPEALQSAISLYEGACVYIDHPERSKLNETRSFDDKFGWLKSVRQDADSGLSGDLHYLKSDPRGAKFAEAAQRNPSLYGLSHNAEGETRNDNGVIVVERINKVVSVDIVTEPATTKTLFEAVQVSQKTTKKLREVCEAVYGEKAKALLEMDGMADTEVEYDEDESDGSDESLKSSIMSILEMDGDPAAKIQKLLELMGAWGKATGMEPAPQPMPESTCSCANCVKESTDAITAKLNTITEAVAALQSKFDEQLTEAVTPQRPKPYVAPKSGGDANLPKDRAELVRRLTTN